MLKIITIYLFHILFFISFKPELISGRTSRRVTENMGCNTTYDCSDFRSICSKTSKTCECASFHDWDSDAKKCIANISRICRWFRATMSTEPETVFQQEDFKPVNVEGITILKTKWAVYDGVKDTGLGHITRVIWPILLGVVVIFFVYGAILLNLL